VDTSSSDAASDSLRIIDVWSLDKIQLGGLLCLAVAGVATKASDVQGEPDVDRSATTDVALFLNEQGTYLKVTAQSIPGRQVPTYDLAPAADASSESAKTWRRLLGGKTSGGVISMTVGISRSASDSPEVRTEKKLDFALHNTPIPTLVGASLGLYLHVINSACLGFKPNEKS
jgi:hypothetical protein